MSQKDIVEKLKLVQLLVLDFDGVFTDGCVYVNQDGVESVKCSRKDGLGINLLHKHGLEAFVISKEINPVVAARCKKLGIPCVQGVHDSDGKLEILKRILDEKGLSSDQIAYMGDDINDYACIEYAGVGITTKDGHESLREIALYTTNACGGDHAVREVCEKILKAKGIVLEF